MRVTAQTQADVADAAWAVALRMTAFGYGEIEAELKISARQAMRIVRGWDAADLLAPVQSGPGLRKLWCIAPEAMRPVPAKGRTAEDNLWTAMRGLKSFTPTDLCAHSTSPDLPITVEDATAYCRTLFAAGYLGVSRKAEPGRREAIYRLARNTGPKPPREKRVRAVIDANTHAIVVIGQVTS
jgi:hypothetical protein